MKELRCRDAGFECDAVIRGETADDVLAQARPHVAGEHHLEVTAEVEEQLAGAIRDQDA